MGVLPLRCACLAQILNISSRYLLWVSSINSWDTSSPSFRSALMPFPMMTCRLSQGGSKMPVHLFQKSTAGNLSRLRKSRNFSQGSNMQKALCSFIIITGQIVYRCSTAYLMKPFRLFIQQRISSGDVKVASSKPPGKRPMFLPYLINLFKFLWLTACTPQSFKMAPVTGKLRINLLPRPMIWANGPSLVEFMSIRRLKPKTLCGCTPKMHRSSYLISSSQMISKLSKYLMGWKTLLMMSIKVWLRRRGS